MTIVQEYYPVSERRFLTKNKGVIVDIIPIILGINAAIRPLTNRPCTIIWNLQRQEKKNNRKGNGQQHDKGKMISVAKRRFKHTSSYRTTGKLPGTYQEQKGLCFITTNRAEHRNAKKIEVIERRPPIKSINITHSIIC